MCKTVFSQYPFFVFKPCPTHQKGTAHENSADKNVRQQKVQQTWNTLKSSANNFTGKSNVSLGD